MEYEKESKEFYDRSFDLSLDSRKVMLSINTAITAGLFYYMVSNLEEMSLLIKIETLITIACFGLSSITTILGMRWDASKYYYLAEMNNSIKEKFFDHSRKQKNIYKKLQLRAKKTAEYAFMTGILLILLLSITILFT